MVLNFLTEIKCVGIKGKRTIDTSAPLLIAWREHKMSYKNDENGHTAVHNLWSLKSHISEQSAHAESLADVCAGRWPLGYFAPYSASSATAELVCRYRKDHKRSLMSLQKFYEEWFSFSSGLVKVCKRTCFWLSLTCSWILLLVHFCLGFIVCAFIFFFF